MSGERVLAFFRKTQGNPFEERLQVESDRRLFGCLGSGSVFGMALAAYALTIQVDSYLKHFPADPVIISCPFPTRVIMPKDYHRPATAKPRIAKIHPKPGQAGHEAPKPKTPHPTTKEPGTLGLDLITSRGGSNSLGAYDLIPKGVKNLDLDKLTDFATLTRTDKTRIGGRRGMASAEFGAAYYQDGTGSGSGGIVLPGLPAASLPNAVRQPQGAMKTVEVETFQNTTTRSTASILAVIRAHSPGLRHLYNTHLKLRPGVAGKITLRFAIAPGGEVVDVGLAGSTTSAPDFDAQVVEAVRSWRFEPVKAIGNDMVTVPFHFSE